MQIAVKHPFVPRPLAIVVALVALSLPTAALAQGPPPAVREAIRAVVDMLGSSGEEALARFAEQHLAPDYRDELGPEGVAAHLGALRVVAQDALGDIGVEMTPQGLLLMLSASTEVQLLLNLDESTGLIHGLDVADSAGPSPGAERRAALREHERAISGLAAGPSVFPDFVADHLAPALVADLGDAGVRALLDEITSAAARAGAIMLESRERGNSVNFRGGINADVVFTLEDSAPYRIDSLTVVPAEPETADDPEIEPLTWETLPGRLEEAEADGFAGTVIAIQGGDVVLDESYGFADREAGRPNDADTVYDIGSMPFDFTRGAIFLLLQRGELSLDDPITRFFPDVPEDKRTITVRHLLDHESGLANFHGRPEDEDFDLSWIDREEAERRILTGPLLFTPGSERSVSHSAYGLLAAIVERVSGRTYQDFLKEEFFEPAGMARTGFYGEDLGLAPEEFAVGYGSRASSPNIPPLWGPTSWLVMGSGGMVSTPADFRRWFEFMQRSGVLSGEPLALYLDRALVTGGSDRGFMATHVWDGDDTMVYMMSNSGGGNSPTRPLLLGLVEMVRGER